MLFIVEKFCLGRDQPMKKSLKILIFITSIIAGIYMLLHFCPLKYGFAYYKDKDPNRESEYQNNYKNYTNGYNLINGLVLQQKEGVYFIYSNKLMLMNGDGEKVEEVLSAEDPIFELAALENNIIFADKRDIYKYQKTGSVKKIINTNSFLDFTAVRVADNSIFEVSSDKIRRFNIDGVLLSEGEFNYTLSMQGLFVKNGYIGYMAIGELDIWQPNYYIINKHFIEYYAHSISARKSYREDDKYFQGEQYKGLERYFLSKLSSKLKEKKYYLVRINPSWGKIGQFYNDELYVVTSISGTVMEENNDEYQYSCDSPECFISKIPVDLSVDKSTEGDFDIVYSGLGEDDYIKSIQIENGYIYFISKKEDVHKLKRLNLESGEVNILYDFDNKDSLWNKVSNVRTYISDKCIFAYIDYSFTDSVEGLKGYSIVRLNKDGTNPVLIMNTEGEVVMKPLEVSN